MRARRFLGRVGALAWKETIHIRRDVRTLYMALGLPVLLLLLFGYGVSFDIDAVPLAVVDQDHSPESRSLQRLFTASDSFRLGAVVRDAAEAERLFRRGEALALLVIPSGFEQDLSRGQEATVQLLLDGADANTANLVRGQAAAAVQAASLRVVRARAGGLEVGLAGSGGVRPWTRFNPEARSALYVVPGLMAYIVAIVAVLLTALTVAREWERGSMEQLFATPVGRLEIVLGKLVPYLGLGVAAVLLVLTVGVWVFGVPFRGSPWVLALDAFLYLIGMLGLGLLISVVTRNQMVATQAATMASVLPTLLLSNFLFPVENMPPVLQWLSRLMPATYFIESLRGILLRGNGLAELWPETLALAGFAFVMVGLSTARFQRRLA